MRDNGSGGGGVVQPELRFRAPAKSVHFQPPGEVKAPMPAT